MPAPIRSRREPIRPSPSPPILVGRSIPHESAQAHVTGQAVYLDDIPPVPQRAPGGVRRQPAGARADRRGRRGRGREDRGDRGRVHRGRRARRQPVRPDLPRRGAAGRGRVPSHRPADRRAGGRESRGPPRGQGGGPDRAGAAARRPDDRRGDRRPPLHRPDAADRAGRRPGRAGAGRARPRGDLPHRRPGAFLPGDPGRAGDPRRVRADHRPLVDAEPERGPGGRRALPRPAPEPGRLHLHPDGRRVRRQGVAGRPSRRCWRPWSPRGPAGRRGSSTRGTWTCGSRASGIRICPATGSASTPTGGSTPLDLELYSDGGCAADLSLAVMERSMLHADNAYFIPHFAVSRDGLPHEPAVEHRDARLRRTAGDRGDRERHRGGRGLPGPRRRSRSAGGTATAAPGRDTTHYGQVVANNTLPVVLDRLAETVGLLAPPRRGRPVQRGVADPRSAAWR